MLRINYFVCRFTLVINLILSLSVNITYMTRFTLSDIFSYAQDFAMYFDVKHNEIHIENITFVYTSLRILLYNAIFTYFSRMEMLNKYYFPYSEKINKFENSKCNKNKKYSCQKKRKKKKIPTHD